MSKSFVPPSDVTWLYPYANTYFPLGMLPPTAMYLMGSNPGNTVRLTLRHPSGSTEPAALSTPRRPRSRGGRAPWSGRARHPRDARGASTHESGRATDDAGGSCSPRRRRRARRWRGARSCDEAPPKAEAAVRDHARGASRRLPLRAPYALWRSEGLRPRCVISLLAQ